jgi:hypothetical protein
MVFLIYLSYVLGSYIFGSVPHLYGLARLQHIKLDGDAHSALWKQGRKSLAVTGILGEFIKGACHLDRQIPGFDILL